MQTSCPKKFQTLSCLQLPSNHKAVRLQAHILLCPAFHIAGIQTPAFLPTLMINILLTPPSPQHKIAFNHQFQSAL